MILTKRKIPLFDLNVGEEEADAVLRVLESKWISMGENVGAFEAEFQAHLGIANAVAVTNCTAALHLALVLVGIKPGDEVIVPSFTFVATVNAVRYVGGKPVFADITSLDMPSIDPSDVAAKITRRTRAIIVMHYAGYPCEMESLLSIAREHRLRLVEDAAHAPGTQYHGKSVGTFGDVGCFSFFSNKNITCAEGGMLVTDDEELARRARLLRAHGMTALSYDRARGHATGYDVLDLGFNYRLDDIRAALGRVQLAKLEADIERRSKLRGAYVERLHDIDKLTIPHQHQEHRSSHYIFPVFLKGATSQERDRVRSQLRSAGIETSVHYPAAHRFSIYRDLGAQVPMTERATDTEITLPLYHDLSLDDIGYVASQVEQAL